MKRSSHSVHANGGGGWGTQREDETDREPEVDIKELLDAEDRALRRRRERHRIQRGAGESWDRRFGIALSGGGIRSATVSLGFLEVLNRAGLFGAADYLSTVSGGGYLGAYVQAAIHNQGRTDDPYRELFSQQVQDRLMAGRHYLAPGTGFAARFRLLRFGTAIAASAVLNLIWMISLLVLVGAGLNLVWRYVPEGTGGPLWSSITLVALAVLAWHFSAHRLRPGLWSAGVLNVIEALLLGAAGLLATRPLASWAAAFPARIETELSNTLAAIGVARQSVAIAQRIQPWPMLGASLVVFGVVGLLSNPNLLTVHGFYKARLAKAYLAIVSKDAKHLRLWKIASHDGWTVGPYPLINGCVNLLRDPDLAGARASDHFLFSPLYCGSRLTGYRRTDRGGYADLELSTAMTASGAAVNPSMGSMTSPALALLLSLLNLRLGYWAPHRKLATWRPTFWPWHLLAEAFQRAGGAREVINVADGGFIENLGVYELLRRRCGLIVALDAACDARYEFEDLRNLMVRARQELGITIDFLQSPERMIRPVASSGFSLSHFVVARAHGLPGSDAAAHGYEGLIIYAKSSLRAASSWKAFGKDKSIAYKTYHPTFPHETTGDQFFDESQWKAYFNLGQRGPTNPHADM
jgi:hypothetical protein